MDLDELAIRNYLEIAEFNIPVDFYIFSSIDSTNRYLKDLDTLSTPDPTSRGLATGSNGLRSNLDPILVCCAETQTQGRGRMQRVWYSPPKENIYCSIRFQFPKNTTGLSTLSLIASLAVLQSLRTLNIADEIQIKWPNDLIWQEKKLCGILIETSPSENQSLNVIIGIGLNVNSDPSTHPTDSTNHKPWCSLHQITGQYFDRNALIANLLINTQQYLTTFKTTGFKTFISLWQRSDYLQGKQIMIQQMNHLHQGTAQGINEHGALLLLDGQGKLISINCGEASVLKNNDDYQ